MNKIQLKRFFVIICISLTISSSFGNSSIGDSSTVDHSIIRSISLSNDSQSQIKLLINNIEDEKLHQKVQNIFNRVITPNGELDLTELTHMLHEYFESVDSNNQTDFNVLIDVMKSYREMIPKIGPEPPLSPRACSINDDQMNTKTIGTSTVFIPPYTSNYSWGYRVELADAYEHSSNRYSGWVGTLAEAWIGGAAAEAVQKVSFYIGRPKSIHVDAKILRVGGKQTVGVPGAAWADTKKTWHIDDWDNYHDAYVDPPLSWEDAIWTLIFLANALTGGPPVDTICQAIVALAQVYEYYEMKEEMEKLYNNNNADEVHVSFTFGPYKGWHDIWVGLRSDASACVLAYGQGVSGGQVTEITIDGIAKPNTPSVSGPSTGTSGVTYDFSATSTDPNDDDIQYQFDWGDGAVSPWSDLVDSGSSIMMSHHYSEPGYYKIKVIGKDIDRMESTIAYHYITIDQPPDTTPPETWITDGPEGWIDYNIVTFQWTGSDDRTSTELLEYSYMLDGWSSWSSWSDSTSETYDNLPDGNYIFKVKSRDGAGNVDETPATRSFTIETPDIIPPETWISDGPQGTIDDNDVVFEYNGVDDRTIQENLLFWYYLEGYSDGWEGHYASNMNYDDLDDGCYRFKVRAEDEAGNTDPSPSVRLFTVEKDPYDRQNWSSFRHNLKHHGYSLSSGPISNNVMWEKRISTGWILQNSPTVLDEKILVAGFEGKYPWDNDYYLYCLDWATGNELWSYKTSSNGCLAGSPTVAQSSCDKYRVYHGTEYGWIYCLDASNGDYKWDYKTNGEIVSSPSVAYARVYIGSNDHKMYCLNTLSGSRKWIFETNGPINSSVAVKEGRIYFGSEDGNIYCLNAINGEYIWSYQTGGGIESSPCVAQNSVVVGSDDGFVYCLNDNDGSLIWRYKTNDFVKSSPAFAYGNIYIGSYDKKMYCINFTSGICLWNFSADDGIWSSPAVADGKIYFGDDWVRYYCLDAFSGNLIWKYCDQYSGNGYRSHSSPAIANGKMYICRFKDILEFGNNQYPNQPRNPCPQDEQMNVDVKINLTWMCDDPDPCDTLQYDVYFGLAGSPLPKVSSGQSEPHYNPGLLDFDTTYYWEIEAIDNHGDSTKSPLWTFTTRTNQPPYQPMNPSPIDNALSVDINSELSWDGGDPDGDQMYYEVYIGTTTPPPFRETIGPFPGSQTRINYTQELLHFDTTYFWQITAVDEYGLRVDSNFGTTTPWSSFTTRDNNPPNIPNSPNPVNRSIDIDINVMLNWYGGDPDNDTTSYNVYMGDSFPLPLVAENISTTEFTPESLDFLTMYYWKITAWDCYNLSTVGPIWEFITRRPIPDLECQGSISWTDVEPGSTETDEFTIQNIGETNSKLDWEIIEWPSWGIWTFTPASGYNLTPENGSITVQVSVITPNEKNMEYSGEIKIVNQENESDYDIIPVSLSTAQGTPETCFLAGTQITMADGTYKNIEDIRVGDFVKGFKRIPQQIIVGLVTNVYHHEPEEMPDFYIVINNKTRVTPNHLLYINNEFIRIGYVQIGDYLGEFEINSIDIVYEKTRSYNFDIIPFIPSESYLIPPINNGADYGYFADDAPALCQKIDSQELLASATVGGTDISHNTTPSIG